MMGLLRNGSASATQAGRAAGIRKPHPTDDSSPAWLVTYGDMATLLLVFFVFLFSVSEIKAEKFKAAAGSLRAHMGVRPRAGSVVESHPPSEVSRRERREKERHGLPGESARVLAAARGKRVALGGSILFELGSAGITTEGRDVLRRLADEIRGLPNIVEIRGHAERGEGDEAEDFADDLDLSLERAANAVRFLAREDDAGLKLRRLRATGAGSEEPAAGGLFADRPERNRRVEVTVVRDTVEVR